jgi:hypothetical protein
MPQINDSFTMDDRLTPVQYAHMERWKDNAYSNDWTGVPGPQPNFSPEGLDRSALEACVGAPFYPGIEAGGLPGSRPIIDPSKFAEPFRLNHKAVNPGGITHVMALPWQNDFFQCADNWWPVPRPNSVIRKGVANQSFTAGVVDSAEDMVDFWHRLGFILSDVGAKHTEFNRCDGARIRLLTPVLDFQDISQGPMGMVREVSLAISFEVFSPSGPVTLQYAPRGAPFHPQLVAFNLSVTEWPTPVDAVATTTARLWVTYRTGVIGSTLPPQTVTVQDSTGTQRWTITILGNTVARKTAAIALVLDRSGSMSKDRGDGQKKHTSMQKAASIFVDVMLEGDGVGIVRFNEAAQVLQEVVALGNGGSSDTNREKTKGIINGPELNPDGHASIGDGILEGHRILNSSATTFDVKALVVLTDGMENRQRTIADVSPQIDEHTYAVGLGKPQNISVPALHAISNNNGDYMLVTGIIGQNNRFMLQKHLLQILAGISSLEVVMTVDGHLVSGRIERVPFRLTAGDAGVDVFLLTPETKIVDFRLQAPSGNITEPWLAMADSKKRFVLSTGVSYYRIALPIEYMANRFDGGGIWHALLTVGEPRLQRSDTRDGIDDSIRYSHADRRVIGTSAAAGGSNSSGHPIPQQEGLQAAAAQRALPYSIVVHAHSNLSLQVHSSQTGFEPGATIHLQALVTQSGVTLPATGLKVWAEVKSPDGNATDLPLGVQGDGRFTASMTPTLPGVYQMRIRARGTTIVGETFGREKTLTAAVWHGRGRGT